MSDLHRKHYKMIAECIKIQWEYTHKDDNPFDILRDLIGLFVWAFSTDNPLFDESKFRKACLPDKED